MAKRILFEVIMFSLFLILVVIQVVVYWACSRSNANDESKLGLDQALLELDNSYLKPKDGYINFTFSQRSHNCYKCNFQYVTTLAYRSNYSLLVDTTFPVDIRVTNDMTGSVSLIDTMHFTERSHYFYTIWYNVSQENYTYGVMVREKAGDNTYLPILCASVVIVAVFLAWILLSFFARYRKENGYCRFFHLNVLDRLTHRDLGTPISSRSASFLQYGTWPGDRDNHHVFDSSYDASTLISHNNDLSRAYRIDDSYTQLQSKRLVSLDTFRGISLVIMIFVNYGGGGYWFFQYSVWNGLTVADLVFPWFVWIMGVSLVFSFRGRKKEKLLHQLYHVLRRTVILFALGLFLTTKDTSLSTMRIPGVLQRLAATYFVVALTEVFTSRIYYRNRVSTDPCSCVFPRDEAAQQEQENRLHRIFVMSCHYLKDLTHNWVQWLLMLLFEMLWLLLTFLLHHQDCPRGYLGPGGIENQGAYQNCTGGAAGLIDRWLLGNSHLDVSSTPKEMYDLQLNFDMEGILGTLNSIVLCYFGVQAGKTLLYFRDRHAAIFLRLIIWGMSLGIIGVILCLGQKNEGWIPLNKNLWSLSYILVMAGSGYLVLALFYLTIDINHWWNGFPFRYPGMNSIIVYVGHKLVEEHFPFAVYNQENSHLTYLTANLVAVSLWMLIAFYWYSLRFFVKI